MRGGSLRDGILTGLSFRLARGYVSGIDDGRVGSPEVG